MVDDRPTPFELFNAALGAYCQADIEEAVLRLRGGFFANLYVAPILIEEEFHLQKIWYPGAEAEPAAAREYARRYGHLWRERASALPFLKEVWNDSLVRAELRNFINLSKNMRSASSGQQLSDLLRERDLFTSPERLRRTQSEILARLQSLDLRMPVAKPRLGLIMLASRDPVASVAFYRSLLGVEPRTTHAAAGGYAEFDFDGVGFAIHGQDRPAEGDPYRLGPPPSSLGWGAIFVFSVNDLDRFHANATSADLPIIDSDLTSKGRRYFVVKDPSGYLLEITEEEPKGFDRGCAGSARP